MTFNNWKQTVGGTCLVLAVALGAGCGDEDPAAPAPAPAPAGNGSNVAPGTGGGAPAAASQDIVATAQAAGSFTTLVAAVQAAGLVDTLKGTGPFTVFAPTDAAFAKLPAGTVENLLKPENKAALQAILKYHVVSGKVLAADVVKLTSARTVEGRDVRIGVNGAQVKINEATVTTADVAASNGVIHVIDGVLLPPM